LRDSKGSYITRIIDVRAGKTCFCPRTFVALLYRQLDGGFSASYYVLEASLRKAVIRRTDASQIVYTLQGVCFAAQYFKLRVE
jgi:hypothetical protein